MCAVIILCIAAAAILALTMSAGLNEKTGNEPDADTEQDW